MKCTCQSCKDFEVSGVIKGRKLFDEMLELDKKIEMEREKAIDRMILGVVSGK